MAFSTMTNQVYCHLAVTGTRSDLDAFVDRVRSRSSTDDAAVLDFNTIVPIPAGHGPYEHWGTMYNAWYADVHRDPETSCLMYTFQTAWEPPDKWLAAASGAFPSLELVNEYVEEMGHLAGRKRWRAGALVDHQELDAAEIEWASDDDFDVEDDGGQSLPAEPTGDEKGPDVPANEKVPDAPVPPADGPPIPFPANDSAEYLDGPDPTYVTPQPGYRQGKRENEA